MNKKENQDYLKYFYQDAGSLETYEKIFKIFAIDHGNVTKAYVFTKNRYTEFAFYGSEEEPYRDEIQTTIYDNELDLRWIQMIKGGQALGIVDKVNSLFAVFYICSHSETKVGTKMCRPCPIGSFSLSGGPCVRCDTPNKDESLTELCSSPETYKPFRT